MTKLSLRTAQRRLPIALTPLGLLTLAACGGGGVGGSSSDGSSGSDRASVGSYVLKGPLSNALVFLDYNGNGVLDADEPSARTAADGSYTLSPSNPNFSIVAITDGSTIDTASGAVLDGITLKAGSGASVVTPATTLMVEGNLTAAQVAQVFGLPDNVDPTSFNPYAVGVSAADALAVEKASQQIISVITAFAGALEGAGANESDAFSAALRAIASTVQAKAAANETLDLTNTSDVALIQTALTDEVSNNSALSAAVNTTALNALIGDTSSAIKNINDEIAAITDTDLTSTATKNVFSTVQVLKDQVEAAAAAEVTAPGSGNIAFTDANAVNTAAANSAPSALVLDSNVISEAAESLVVGVITTTDNDQPTDVAFTYSIIQVAGSDFDKFTINSATGQLSLIEQPDFETKASYTIVVKSVDAGGKALSKTFSVAVTDENDAPRDSVEINESGILDDHANIRTTAATLLELGAVANGEIELNGDVDIFRLPVESGQQYTVSLNNLDDTDISSENIYLGIYNVNGFESSIPASGGGTNSFTFEADGTGTVYLQVENASSTGPDGNTYTVEISLNTDGGESILVDPPTRFQGMEGSFQDRNPQAITLRNENNEDIVVLAWQGETSDGQGSDIFVKTYSSSGDQNLMRLQGRPDSQIDEMPKISAIGTNSFVVVWHGNSTLSKEWDIYVQKFDSNGQPEAAGFQTLQGYSLSNEGQRVIGMMQDEAPAVSAFEGGFIVAWQGDTSDGQASDIFVQRFDEDGSKLGDIIRLRGMDGNLDDKSPQVEAFSKGFIVAWSGSTSDEQSEDVFIQRFDEDGEKLGDLIRLSGMAGNLLDWQPKVSVLPDDRSIVTWTANTHDGQGWDIFVQIFEQEGHAAVSEARLQGMLGDLRDLNSQVAILSDGGFVVVWQGWTSDDQGFDIFFQKFKNNGTRDGDTVRLKGMEGNLGDWYPKVIPSQDGGFLIVWNGATSTGQNFDIFIQKVDAEGYIEKIQSQGHSGNFSDWGAEITSFSKGKYLVSWHGETFDGQGSDIFIEYYADDNGILYKSNIDIL